MIIVTLTDSEMSSAKALANQLGKINNSIIKGRGNLAGFCGEIATAKHLCSVGFEVDHTNTYEYDLIADGITVDVKSKNCNSPPRPNYDCSVANYNTKQKCDRYVFTRVNNNIVYLVGWISKDKFYQQALFHTKGELDSNFVNGKQFTFHADCWNIAISQLNRFTKNA
tara:strand:- start:77 stop:580 length:504 start_codon:yes stop_codon:yes gene_type:complete